MLAAPSARFGALITAARLTGCRQDELVNVTWPQFNPRAKTLDVIGKVTAAERSNSRTRPRHSRTCSEAS